MRPLQSQVFRTPNVVETDVTTAGFAHLSRRRNQAAQQRDVGGRFEGEFASHSATYAGTGSVR
jgi:hypothetical protein